MQSLDLAERVDQLVGDPVAEVLVLGIARSRSRTGARRWCGPRARCRERARRARSRDAATSASAKSAIAGKRSPGSLASARASARSIAGGHVGHARRPMGAAPRWRAAPWWRGRRCRANGGSPASISYSTQARLYWSLRAVEPALRAGLLGTHVGRRADGEPPIGDVHAARRRRPRSRWRRRSRRRTGSPSCEEDVLGLDVAVDRRRGGGRKSSAPRDRAGDPQRDVHRQRALAGQPVAQALAAGVRHDDVDQYEHAALGTRPSRAAARSAGGPGARRSGSRGGSAAARHPRPAPAGAP